MTFERTRSMSRRWALWSFGLLTLGLVLAACAPRAPVIDLAAEERAIKEASLNWSKAERSGGHDSVATFFWEDAVLQPPGQSQIQGHDAIRAFFAPARLRDSGRPRPVFPVHISASGDLAVEWGRSSITVERPEGPTLVHFKFVNVWERRGEVWKVRLNSWNGDPAQDNE